MEARRKPAVCRALLVLLLIVASSAAVSTAHPDDHEDRCWKDDDHHPICVVEDCVSTCKDHGHVGGRCNWAWSWRPYCQCQLADCQ